MQRRTATTLARTLHSQHSLLVAARRSLRSSGGSNGAVLVQAGALASFPLPLPSRLLLPPLGRPTARGAPRRLSSSSSIVDSYSSSGVIIDPYMDYYVKEKAAKAAPFYSLEALRTKIDGVKSKLASGVSFGHIRRHVKAFSLKTLSKECNGIFTEFHDAFERGDVKRLAALCTEDLYLNLKIKMKREQQTRRVLRFLSFTQPTIVVHGRHLYTSGGRGIRTQTGYGQVTVVVSSRREEFDVDVRGKRVRSSQGQQGQRPPAIFDNESICVLEVAFSDPKGRWRLASIVEEPRKTDPVASAMVAEPVGL